jgi:small subunit ribosomal protein S4e
MHLTRKESTTKLPVPRKGTKYLARASSHVNNSITVVMAVRDMLHLAKTAKEVKEMIKQKMLKINGRVVKDYRESILLFNILEADKSYELSILPSKKYSLKAVKNKDIRLCKVVNKRLIKAGAVQLNLHDGTNILSKDKINVGDSVYLDLKNNIKKHVSFDKGKEVFIFSGKYAGHEGKISNINLSKVDVKMDGGSANLDSDSLVAI